MKILFVIPTLGTGGAERVATILANYFSENNKVEIFVMEKSDTARYPIKDKVSINEAVELAKKYGEDNSKTFVNGILASIVKK